jgi:toxin FitB
MKYLVDTNVVSAVVAPAPAPSVMQWMDSQPLDDLCLSVLTVGELEKGIALLAPSARQRRLREWLDTDVAVAFAGRILPVDEAIARVWGELSGRLERSGDKPKVVDAQIAATALVHDLIVVTRNVVGFERSGVRVINPWDD